MSNHLLIYLIVLLNLLCQAMLIWRQKFLRSSRWLYIGLAAALPLGTALSMRLLIAGSIIHGHLAQQTRTEHLVTQAMSVLLLAGPWLVTGAAAIANRSGKLAAKQRD
jgi:hypothetical protein